MYYIPLFDLILIYLWLYVECKVELFPLLICNGPILSFISCCFVQLSRSVVLVVCLFFLSNCFDLIFCLFIFVVRSL